ncbi:MAG: TIR domain-containing protein [Gemmatimonadetes bacterium]|nr:TIR domain-containing protein [Gemmatimonadota bacterium]
MLAELAPGIRIFRDVERLHTGHDYRIALDRAVRRSERFVPLLTPSYVLSKACQDEFNAAWSIREQHELALFFPLALKQASLNDPRMAYLQCEDCMEADLQKLRSSCQNLVRSLGLAAAEATVAAG